MLKLNEQRMLPGVRRKLMNMSLEEQATLDYAFRNAIEKPELVAEYKSRIWRSCLTGMYYRIHRFRIGYAVFLIADPIGNLPIAILDLRLEDEIFQFLQ